MLRTYLELIQIPTFEERFKYCQCFGRPSEVTFGGHRLLNQILYRSPRWKEIRRRVIIRDDGCDLGIADRPINPVRNDGKTDKENIIIIHHLNPITIEQVISNDPCVYDLNNLICVSDKTHKAIHYGNLDLLTPSIPIERIQGDTKLW